MLRRFSVNFAIFSIGLDYFLITASLIIAVRFRPSLSTLPFARYIPADLSIPWFIYIIFPLIWVAILLLFSVYDGRKNLKFVDEFTSLTLGTILSAVALAGTLYLSYRDISRLLFILFVFLAYSLLLVWRAAFYLILWRSMLSEHHRILLIVGAGDLGQEVSRQIIEYPYYGISFIGYLDDQIIPHNGEHKILGTINDASQVIEANSVSDVVITLPQRAYEQINDLVAELHNLPVKVWIIPDYFHLALNKAVFEDFAGLPMLDLRAPALTEYQRMLKRAFDLILTILFLPLSLFLAVFISLAIRLESKGPIFFKQERVGENGRLFEMYKFRTMQPDAEQYRDLVEHYDTDGILIHKSRNDPRVTRVGNFLRKTSMDEIPQLINIIKGEMSLVGPRPELPYLVSQYDAWQRKRFAVPQGITGWWQIHGRSDKPMHLHTEDDLYYVQNYSIFLDMYILIRTVRAVLRGQGAF